MPEECIASQSEVIRAIVSDYSPCCGVPRTVFANTARPARLALMSPPDRTTQSEVIRATMLDGMLDGGQHVLQCCMNKARVRRLSFVWP